LRTSSTVGTRIPEHVIPKRTTLAAAFLDARLVEEYQGRLVSVLSSDVRVYSGGLTDNAADAMSAMLFQNLRTSDDFTWIGVQLGNPAYVLAPG